MITVFREYFKKGSQLILWIIIFAFIVGLMPMAFRHVTGSSEWAFRVNGQDIGYKEFLIEQERQKEYLMALRAQFGEYLDLLLGSLDSKSLAMKSLIRQELINQFGDTLGIQMSSDTIAQKMSDPTYVREELSGVIPPQLVDPMSGINHDMLRRYLKHAGISVETFERSIERALLDKLIMNFVGSTAYIPEFDLKQKYQSEYAKKSFSLLALSLKDLIKKEKETALSSEDLQSYYDAQNNNIKKYWVPEKRSGVMWTFTPAQYAIHISPAELEKYYEDNKLKKFIETPAMVQVRRILIAVPDATQYAAMQEKAARIKDEILQDPSRFKEIAQRVSDDKETAQNGGLLEPFSRGTHEIIFDKTAFLLPEDGAVSDVIETSNGLEILQRVNKKPQAFKSLSSVKNEIEETLKQQKFAKQLSVDLKKVIEDEAALAQFITDKGGVPKELKKVTAEEMQQLFTLQKGEKTFFIEGDKGVALRLDSIHEPYVPSLEMIKNTVLNDYYKEKAQESLQEKLKLIKKEIEKTPPQELQKTFGGEFIQTGWLEPGSTEGLDRLKSKGAPIDQMLQMEKVGSVLMHGDAENGFVVRLDEIEPFNEQNFAKKQAEMGRSLEQERLDQYLQGFVASLHRNAKIETNNAVITLQS